jgi:hypothetical protein
MREGDGVLTYPNGDVFTGKFHRDVRCDSNGLVSFYGTMAYSNAGSYDGQWWKELFHGKGKRAYINGDTYEGEFDAGQAHTTGTMQYFNGSSYKGEWSRGEYHGTGEYTYSSGPFISYYGKVYLSLFLLSLSLFALN